MGYQESLVHVESLAEVAGIDSAMKQWDELHLAEWVSCYCAARAKRDLYWGGWSGEIPLEKAVASGRRIIKKDELFAVLVGRRMYQPFRLIDTIAGIDELGYEALLEDIPLEEAYKDAESNPEAARKGELFMKKSLMHSYDFAFGKKYPVEYPAAFLEGLPLDE